MIDGQHITTPPMSPRYTHLQRKQFTQKQIMTNNTNKKQKAFEAGNNINITEILYACLSRWYWFIISLTIALSIAT